MSRADGLELSEFIDPASVTVEEAQLGEGDHGDLGLVTAIVLLSVPALKAFIAYLAYRHRGKSFEQTIEIENADGTTIKKVLRWRDTSAEPLDVSLCKQLASSSGLPFDQLVKNG